MEVERAAADVIAFPGHRLGTLTDTMAGFRGASAASHPRRRRDRVTVLEADLRGLDLVATAVGGAEAERLLQAVADRAVRAVAGFGPEAVSLSGDPRVPMVSGTFEHADQCRRALRAATALRDAVDA